MGGLTRKPIVLKKPKPSKMKDAPKPRNVIVSEKQLDQLAFGPQKSKGKK